MTRRKSSRSSRKGSVAPTINRAGVVWAALLGAMTIVGGGLFAMDGRMTPRMDGLSLPPLVASAGPTTLEALYNTRSAIGDRRWNSIVIHHSGSAVGSPATIEAQHKAMSFKGLGYHFVIGNGTGTEDGELYVGYRWRDQLPGAHVAGPKGDDLNRNSIGICIVGDGRRQPFSQSQIRRLVQLVNSLSEKLDIPADHIYLHSDVAAIESPGRLFPEASFREQLRSAR